MKRGRCLGSSGQDRKLERGINSAATQDSSRQATRCHAVPTVESGSPSTRDSTPSTTSSASQTWDSSTSSSASTASRPHRSSVPLDGAGNGATLRRAWALTPRTNRHVEAADGTDSDSRPRRRERDQRSSSGATRGGTPGLDRSVRRVRDEDSQRRSRPVANQRGDPLRAGVVPEGRTHSVCWARSVTASPSTCSRSRVS